MAAWALWQISAKKSLQDISRHMLECNVYDVSGTEWVWLEPAQQDVHFHHFTKEFPE